MRCLQISYRLLSRAQQAVVFRLPIVVALTAMTQNAARSEAKPPFDLFPIVTKAAGSCQEPTVSGTLG
jgi:hypothetical protein